MDSETARAYAGIGANLGDAAGTLAAAVRKLDASRGVHVRRASPVYRTPPVGPQDQPDYLNAVLELDVTLEPRALLDLFLSIEQSFGRVRKEKWGPRTLDLDILLYADRVVQEEGLKVPHPHMHERAFVLIPLCDLSPTGRHPILNADFQTLARSVATDGIRRAEGVSLPGGTGT